MNAKTHITKTSSAWAVLVNIGIIVCGVFVLLRLSMLGDNDIRSKMDFFSTGAGNFVALIFFLIPTVILMHRISYGEMTAKKITYSIVAMLSVQLLLFSFTPTIVQAYQSTGSSISEFIIGFKK